MNWVLHQAYLEPDAGLKAESDRARFFNEQREAAYASKAELERTQAALRRGNSRAATTRSVTLAETYRPGARAVAMGASKPATVAQDLQKITVLCNTADENSQMANLNLQNALQKQQQTLQTLSNVSKALHDTAMAVIRKIGG